MSAIQKMDSVHQQDWKLYWKCIPSRTQRVRISQIDLNYNEIGEYNCMFMYVRTHSIIGCSSDLRKKLTILRNLISEYKRVV